MPSNIHYMSLSLFLSQDRAIFFRCKKKISLTLGTGQIKENYRKGNYFFCSNEFCIITSTIYLISLITAWTLYSKHRERAKCWQMCIKNCRRYCPSLSRNFFFPFLLRWCSYYFILFSLNFHHHYEVWKLSFFFTVLPPHKKATSGPHASNNRPFLVLWCQPLYNSTTVFNLILTTLTKKKKNKSLQSLKDQKCKALVFYKFSLLKILPRKTIL